MKLRRFEGNPILSPNPRNAWESLVTTNPGAWYDAERKQVLLLYRAAGKDVDHKIHFGLAVSKDGFHFRRASREPVFSPSADGFDAGCVEDPRIVKIGEYHFITYACRAFAPGQYWLPMELNKSVRPPAPADFPHALRSNWTATGLALTKDFKTFIRAGRLTNPMLDDRDVILFPEKIGGRYIMIHRPMQWIGAKYGTEKPAMWISASEDLLTFRDSRLLAKGVRDWECNKVGGNNPPIKTPDGWLLIYHGVGPDWHYRLGAMLLDLEEPSRILHRTPDWIMQPEEEYETRGLYNGVVFPCGNVVIGDTFFVYYGGADQYVGVATCSLKKLLAHLKSCPA